MIEALEKSLGIVTSACKAVGISRQTHYNWYNDDKKYKELVDDVENIALDFVESKHYKNIEAGKESSTIFHLKTKGKKRGYSEREGDDHDINVNIIRKVKPAPTEDNG